MTPILERIFCCRSLRLDQVELVGFDMDYTLAVYRQAEMERLATDATLRRLVEAGYAEQLLEVTCPWDFPIRGLLVDLEEGNVLKMDRFRYVKVGYHGLRRLTRAERQRYEGRRPRLGNERYRWIDTAYSLPDVAVYVAAIDLLEQRGPVDHRQLWEDVRRCADVAHQSGEIYEAVLGDLDRYVTPDPDMVPMLERLRRSGKRTFLLTNSPASTTQALMGRLLGGDEADTTWRQHFDVAIADARKPLWFTGDRPFGDAEEPDRPVERLEQGRLYHGGNQADFERLVGGVGGPRVLYVGDHIYGDVLRANVESGWRTCMVVGEMAEELIVGSGQGGALARIDALDAEVQELYDAVRAREAGVDAQGLGLDDPVLRRAVERARVFEEERDAIETEVDRVLHPYWGSLFKAGTELSMFGAQVEKYAWLYTTRASNLGGYSPFHFFRSPRARLPHE